MFSPLTTKLMEALRCLPGVGPRTAQRMAFHLLAESGKSKGLQLAEALQHALTQVGYCGRCRTYSEQSLCDLCRNEKRDGSTVCVVETPADVMAVEQTSSYRGHYFVLHGHLSPLDGIGPQELAIPELLHRLEDDAITELILATNPTVEGKATAHYIANNVNTSRVKCSRIAFGVPMGGELEYLDGNTLTHALSSRIVLTNE